MIVWQNLLLKVGRVMYVWFLTKTTRINVWLVCVLNQELSQVRPCVKYVSLKHGQNLIIFKDLFTTSLHIHRIFHHCTMIHLIPLTAGQKTCSGSNSVILDTELEVAICI